MPKKPQQKTETNKIIENSKTTVNNKNRKLQNGAQKEKQPKTILQTDLVSHSSNTSFLFTIDSKEVNQDKVEREDQILMLNCTDLFVQFRCRILPERFVFFFLVLQISLRLMFYFGHVTTLPKINGTVHYNLHQTALV